MNFSRHDEYMETVGIKISNLTKLKANELERK